jgi:hypothetical protein
MEAFAKLLGANLQVTFSGQAPADRRRSFDPAKRQKIRSRRWRTLRKRWFADRSMYASSSICTK